MANRVELTEQEANNVAGGAFWYNTHTNEDGSEYMTCFVDNVGEFYCTENAKRQISRYIVSNSDATLESTVQFALDNGYFWT